MPLPDAPVRPSLSRRPDPSGRHELGARPGRRRLARRLRGLLWRGRFVLAALCCGLAATTVVQALRPEPPPTVDVVVPAHLLPAGEVVRTDDLAKATVPAALAPDGVVTDVAAVVGRSPAIALPAGIPLHPDLVPGGGVVAQAPEGSVVVPVRLDDTASGWLRPGDRVDLVVAGEESRAAGAGEDDGADGYLARRALVLPRPAADGRQDASGGLLGGGGASPDGADVTLVAVSPDEAPSLSAASGWGTVGAVLVR